MTDSNPVPRDEDAIARRRLLALGGRYVAPAILITLALDGTAHGQASCGPSNCPPASCLPKDNCSPARTGG
jgi:hypothetical protein